MVKVKKDLTGQKFGRLTVIEQVDDYISPKGQHQSQWLCECDCADKTKLVVRGYSLITRGTLSCGCLFKEQCVRNEKNNKKYNVYDLTGDYGIGYTSKGENFYFDLEDYDKIKNYCWCVDSQGYIKSGNIFLHRIIMNSPSVRFDIDHKHGKNTRHDNRKSNLRIATRNQNSMNKERQSNNISGVTGVSYDKSRNKWIARLIFEGKCHSKRFINFEDAVAQRKEWENTYFGEFSYDNSMRDING